VCKHFYEPEPFVKPLEKIEMKKTLVAVAAMAVVTGSMADITLSGNIDQALNNMKSGVASKTSDISGSGMGSGTLGDTFLTISGSEEITGGIKASFKIEPQLSPNAAAHSMANREAWVGLSGGFGSVQIGTVYTPIFNLVAAGTDVGGVSNAVGWLPATSGTATISAGGNSAVSYTLPSLATGLSLQAIMKKGGANSVGNNVATTYGAGALAGTIAAAGQGAQDGTGLAVSYAMGAFTVGYGTETTKNVQLAFVNNQMAYQVVSAASTTQSVKNTDLALTYNAGFANLTYLNAKAALGIASIKTSTYGISVPLGATTINYTMSSQTSTTGLAAAVEQKFSGSQLQAKYALSKRTTAYLQQGGINNKTAGAAGAATGKLAETSIGIAHSF